MKTLCVILVMMISTRLLYAQGDEEQVRKYYASAFPKQAVPEKILFYQSRYKPGKTWQYLIACNTTTAQKPVTTLLFAERVKDSVLRFEPFHFAAVESFDHFNMDNSRDRVEEYYITTAKDSENLEEKYTGIYSCKKGFVDTLIRFYSFEVKSLKAPYFTYQPGKVIEQEDICKIADVNGDGKIDIANRVHRKTINKDAGTDTYTFDHETDYAEYTFAKGKLVKMKSKTGAAAVAE